MAKTVSVKTVLPAILNRVMATARAMTATVAMIAFVNLMAKNAKMVSVSLMAKSVKKAFAKVRVPTANARMVSKNAMMVSKSVGTQISETETMPAIVVNLVRMAKTD